MSWHQYSQMAQLSHFLPAFFAVGAADAAFLGAAAAAAATFLLCNARVHFAFCGTSTASPPAA